jgi:serine/threonine protein kinase
VVAEIAKVLARAHDLDIVHRDLKPANVFLVEDDAGFVVKLLDFGVAKILHRGAPPSDQQTEPGSPIGTLQNMSPEQLRGVEVGVRTDIWTLDILSFECLTGATPFASLAPPNLITAICSAPIAKISSIAEASPSLAEWFDRCICRDVELRESSVREMARHFMRITEGETGLLPLLLDPERLSVPSVVAYTSTDASFEEPRVSSSIPAAINDRRDIEHVALISRINRESAVLWTRRRCVKGQLMKLTLHVTAEDDGYSTLARVVGVKKHPEGAPSLWHYGVNVRFEQPLEGLDAELEALGLTPSRPPPRP